MSASMSCEFQVKDLTAEVTALKKSGVTTTIYQVAPPTAAPRQDQSFMRTPYSNIPPYKIIPAHTTAR